MTYAVARFWSRHFYLEWGQGYRTSCDGREEDGEAGVESNEHTVGVGAGRREQSRDSAWI